jgi:type IV pilus assembly protein PilC
MPVYKYEALKRDGEKITGDVNLPNEGEVRIFLRQRGARVLKIQKESLFNKEINISFLGLGGAKVNESEVAIMTRQLAVMIEAGVPILQSLDILQTGEKNPALKKALAAVSESVSGGNPLWEALSNQKGIFSHLFVYLIRAGELGGSLDIILKRLAKYMDDNVRLTRMVKGAMVYPAIVTFVGLVVTFGLIVFIVPQFESLISNSGGELPAITKFVIDLSHFCGDYFFVIVGGAIGAYSGFNYSIKTPGGKRNWHRFLLHTPMVKDLVIKSSVARFTRTLGTMLTSGINLIDAIEVCKLTLDNVIIQDALGVVRDEVASGQSIALPLAKAKIFPPMVIQMINVGENTGALDQMLIRIADFYESEVETIILALTKLIEPIVLVVLGGMVATILIAMYLPVFQLSGAAGKEY